MTNDVWGVVGCSYMAREYCKALTRKGIMPEVYTRDLASPNVGPFQKSFPQLHVRALADVGTTVNNWIVCTNIESHQEVCSRLVGRLYCEKPYAHTTDYTGSDSIRILMNRRYYHWVGFIKEIVDGGHIEKIVACVPEKSADALITQSIHVVDLIWHIAGPFETAQKLGSASPSFFFRAGNKVPVILNMNYGAHENFSIRFYAKDGVVYEAKPLEFFSLTRGMEVCEPTDQNPLRGYRPISHPLEHAPTGLKPGLDELVDELIGGTPSRLPTLSEHREIHAWMERNMR